MKIKPRFKKGDWLYYIQGSRVERAKVTRCLWAAGCWTYDCTEPPDFFYITEMDFADQPPYDENTTYPYATEILALIALRNQLVRQLHTIESDLATINKKIEA